MAKGLVEPRMIEGDIFKTIVPLDDTYSSSITMNGKATIKSDDKNSEKI